MQRFKLSRSTPRFLPQRAERLQGPQARRGGDRRRRRATARGIAASTGDYSSPYLCQPTLLLWLIAPSVGSEHILVTPTNPFSSACGEECSPSRNGHSRRRVAQVCCDKNRAQREADSVDFSSDRIAPQPRGHNERE